jgi:hypothetical protein
VPQVVAATCGREVVWRLPTLSRIRQILTNPTYAGVLAYGRTVTRTVVEQGRARHAGRRRKPRDQWKVLILDNHAGYIDWEEFQSHLRILGERRVVGYQRWTTDQDMGLIDQHT